jgi:pimeloyl-ACP methyl ester carboxylesterase
MVVSDKAKEELIDVNGLSINVRSWGNRKSKSAIIMLHGYAETSRIWDDSAQDLSRDYHVIAIDQRGYGNSGYSKDLEYGRTIQVEDLRKIIEEKKLTSISMIGHDMGAANGIAYTAENPEIVTAMVIIESSPDVLRNGIENIRKLVAIGNKFASIESAMALFKEYFPYANNDQLRRRVQSILKVGVKDQFFYWDFDPMFKDPTARPANNNTSQKRIPDLWELIDRIQCPTMIVRGTHSDLVTPEAMERMHRRIPGSRISLIEEAGHAVPTDQPGQLALNIREFLQNLSNNVF